MVKLFSVKEMHDLEEEANTKGLSYAKMMENAGEGIAKELDSAYRHIHNKKIMALIGPGNNGGDALVALTSLSTIEWETYAYIIKDREADDPLVKRLEDAGGKIINGKDDKNYESLKKLLNSCSVLLDGVFGTGIKLPLHGEVAHLLSFINKYFETLGSKPSVVAVDCPSGTDCETGECAEETIPADITVTLAGYKVGLTRFPAVKFAGEVRVGSIGPIDDLDVYKNNEKIILDKEFIKKIIPVRPLDSHKGSFGTALIIAGSLNYTGAALLAGLAAYRSGVGLVTTAVPAPLHETLAGQFPESTWLLLPHDMGVISADAARVVISNIDRATALLIGPGFSLEDTTREFIHRLFTENKIVPVRDIGFVHDENFENHDNKIYKPAVFDADGLKLLSKIPNWEKIIPSPAILTPHPGEMAVITGLPVSEIQADRINVAREFSKKWNHVVVLKGAFTIIAAPDGRIAVVPIATPALAEAGTGDVLAGSIVGFRAQGVEAFNAACAGAWIHAEAGLLAAKRIGNNVSVIAGDVLEAISAVITELKPL